MAAIFSQILNMSMTGSVVILLVILARLILKRSPKIFSYALWSVVLFRLLCPVAFTAPVSVLDVVEPEQKETSNNTSIVTYIPATVNTQADFIMVQPEEQQVQVESDTELEEQLRMTPMHAIALVWAAGMAGMMLYSVVQYLGLRRKLVGSVQLKGNIYLADHIDTAFVVGLLQPRIYLPSSVPNKERYFILTHEQHHIRRFDHAIKLLAYLALCIHWFNPLVWLSFVLAGMDMEMSCDEAVIKKLGPEIRADYSASLLRLATHRKILSGMPLAFGEGDTKGRVVNMAKWRKPTKWVVAICVILCLCIVVVCAFNPEEEKTIEELTRHTADGPVGTGIEDLYFTYPSGLTSELREVENWSREEQLRTILGLPTRGQFDNFFIDHGVDFGGVVNFIVPEDREIQLEELKLPSAWIGLDYRSGSSTYPCVEMEYTLVKDGKDYIKLYLYTYSGNGYFLWFYEEQGNPAHKEAILQSVELGTGGRITTKLKHNEELSLGQFNITILKGYGYHKEGNEILEITRKERFGEQVVVGCVTARPNPYLPMETDSDWVQWVEAVGLDLHRDDPNYRYTKSITGSGEFGDISLTLEEVVDKKLLMSERHYFYIAGDIVYHLWFDAMEMNWTDDKQMLESIWIKESCNVPSAKNSETAVGMPQPQEETESDMPTVPSDDIITDAQSIQYGSLHFSLPDGMEAADENGIIALTFVGKNIGGIALRHPEQPNSPDSFSRAWQAAMGVPEASKPMAYMGGGSLYADYETTYSLDVALNYDENGNIIRDEIGILALESEVTHYFFIHENDIYDIWLYDNRLPNKHQESLLKSCYIEGVTDIAAMENALNKEQKALEQCRWVLEQIQSSGACKIETKQKNGPAALNDTTLRTDWISGDDRLIICIIPESGGSSTVGALRVSGEEYECNSERKWREITNWEWADSWLASFQWDDSVVSYMDTMTNESGTTVMLRIDQPFAEGEDQQPHYFVSFNYDTEGTFMNVYLQTNVFMSNAISKTESVVSLDPERINADIQKEYLDANGETIKQQLPDNPNYAVLEFIDDPGLIVITNHESVEGLLALFVNAEPLDQEPQNHKISVDGVDLNLVFVEGVEEYEIELDPGTSLCRINGEYLWYGKPDSPDAIYKLWEYMGITRWPDIVYQVCKNALKP